MHLIVGLGNYGTKYKLTRHNIGFLTIDALAETTDTMTSFSKGQKALVAKGTIAGARVVLAKPQTYMNLSGSSVKELLSYYKIPISQLLVIQDEIELEFGRLKVQKARGHAGHNGIRDIHKELNTNEYSRLKFGVSRPPHPKMNVADYLLSDFNKDEQSQLVDLLGPACECIESFITNGFDKTANQFNQRK